MENEEEDEEQVEENLIGELIGNCNVIKELANGGFGRVYYGEHHFIPERSVAIKLLHPRLLRSSPERESFLAEARLLEKLRHPHILPVYDAGVHKDVRPYIITEYAPGGQLRERLRGQPLPVEEAMTILTQVGYALAHAHTQDIVHRDLKPENIFFNATGEALLGDFGIAVVLQTTDPASFDIRGSLPYMAPEQWEGHPVPASDQYALGCIAYELFTGRLPFYHPKWGWEEFKKQHLEREPKPPGELNPTLPAYIEQAILRAMAKDSAKRYESVTAFLQALSKVTHKKIGNYYVMEELARGGYAIVYRGENETVRDLVVAIKLLLPQHAASEVERKRFIEEAQFLVKLEHSSILPVSDVGIDNGSPYIITKCALGGTLRERLQRSFPNPLPIDEASRILTQIGQALNYAHQQKIVHRDLKPENILFNAEGGVLLADFGIAVVLQTAGLLGFDALGSQEYMAPEQWEGHPVPASDQYALGCIAYELFTGRWPFYHPKWGREKFKEAHLKNRPLPPGRLNPQLPTYIEQAILKALEKKPTDRHPDVAAFIRALQKSARDWLAEANTSYRARRFEEALNAYEKAIELDARLIDAYNGKGKALYSLNRKNEAMAAYEQTLRLHPTNADAYIGKGNLLKKLKHYKEAQKAYEEALRVYEQAVGLDPLRASSYQGKGLALYNLEQYKEALTAYEQAIALDPDDAHTHNNKGNALRALKRYEAALAAHEQAFQLHPGVASFCVNTGNVLCELKRYEEALGTYEEAIRLDFTNGYAYNGKGNVLLTFKRNEEALQAYEQAIHHDPNQGVFYYNWGRALERTGQSEEAERAWDRARQLGYKC
jgi:serine/threonine protein kinase/Tfp pilus assembly protein PilF